MFSCPHLYPKSPKLTTIPYVIIRTHGDERQTDIYSAMLEERAIFINGTIDDDTSSAVMAELLFLEAYAPEKTISLPYANTSIFQIISRKDNSEIKDNSIGIS